MGGRQLLALAVAAKSFGEKPSARFGIIDEVMALDFDLAAALMLKVYDPDALTQLIHALASSASGGDGGGVVNYS